MIHDYRKWLRSGYSANFSTWLQAREKRALSMPDAYFPVINGAGKRRRHDSAAALLAERPAKANAKEGFNAKLALLISNLEDSLSKMTS